MVSDTNIWKGKSKDSKFVSTFGAFCQNPSSSFRNGSFFPRTGKLGWHDCPPSCTGHVLVMDATFKTNVQDLVPASLGLVILQVGGLVRNRFWQVVCAQQQEEK